MPTCYICSCAIPRGQGNRRRVNTGYSVAGFNFSPNPFLGVFLNSLLRKRAAAIRNYYSMQTLCHACTAAHDARERRKVLLLALVVIISAFVFFGVIVAKR